MELKIGDELLQRQSGSSANLIRKIDNIVSGLVYFDNGYVEILRKVENSGKWSKIEPIRGDKAKVQTSDIVHLRDKFIPVKYQDGFYAYFDDSSNRRVPLKDIHYDKAANQFWSMTQTDLRVGDIVTHGTFRYKVGSIDFAGDRIIFEGGKVWVSTDKILVDSEERCFYICDSNELTLKEPVLECGTLVIHKQWSFEVGSVKGTTVKFLNGGEIEKNRLNVTSDKWYIPSDTAFFDVGMPPTGNYWLLADKCEVALTEKLRYAHTKGFRLWGPTVVKGDHYAQAARK